MISEGLNQTVDWFHNAVDLQARRIQRLEVALFVYRAGFLVMAILWVPFVAFIVGYIFGCFLGG
jgi:hypothetical protein